MPNQSTFQYLYGAIALARMVGEIGQITWLVYLANPLITISLGWYLLARSPDWPTDAQKRAVILGLAFACLGDLALVIGGTQGLALGLIAFLVTHLVYTLALALPRPEPGQPTLLHRRPYLVLPFLLLAALIYVQLGPNLQAFWLPVLLYTVLLPVMVLAALNRLGRVEPTSFWLVLAGTLTLATSDVLVGVNRFANPTPSHALSIAVVATYIAAQYLIVVGLRRHAVW
jgi:uncharacterized membrane protein YhhN